LWQSGQAKNVQMNYPKYASNKSWNPQAYNYQRKSFKSPEYARYEQNKYWVPRGRSLEPEPESETKTTTIEDHQDWEHYHSHRDRRDLYEKLSHSISE
jgi:hypothetical protein